MITIQFQSEAPWAAVCAALTELGIAYSAGLIWLPRIAAHPLAHRWEISLRA